MAHQHILVVEDYEHLLMAIKAILESAGYSVSTATSRTQALQALEETRPDLIVADVLTPATDGHTLHESVHARPEWASIPFIFLTSQAEPEGLKEDRKLRSENYITKPFDAEDLLTAVRNRLKGTQISDDR